MSMAHIHTQDNQHDFTACAFILRTDLKEPALMFHKHRLLQKLLQFGGHVELDESPWAAVVREIREESGYDIDQLRIFQPKDWPTDIDNALACPLPFMVSTHRFGDLAHFHNDLAFAFVANEEPRHQPEDGETQTFTYLTRQQLAGLSADAIPKNVQRIALFMFDHVCSTWEAMPADMHRQK